MVGSEFRVNETTISSQFDPSITALDTGGFVVTWSDSSGRDGSGQGIFGQQYDASGGRVDEQFQVNTEFSSTQSLSAVTGLPGGNFVVAWTSVTSGTAGDGSSNGVFSQLFGTPGDFSPQAAPVLDGVNDTVTFAENALNAAPQLLDANGSVALSDPDSANFDGGRLEVTRVTNTQALIEQFNPPDDLSQDQLGIRNQGTGAGQIGVSGTDVTFGGTVIGSIVS